VRILTITLILATAATAATAPVAGAHGDDNAVYGETVNGTGEFVVAYAREKSFKKRDDTVAVTAGCERTRVYRARVFGHVVTRNDKIRHRARGTTAAEAIACD
jgi:hypothetical protein